MKVIINNKIYDSETTPIMLVWESEQARHQFLDNISNMEPKDGVRIFAEFPDGSDEHEVEKMLDLATEAINFKLTNLKALMYCHACGDLGREGGCHNCSREFNHKTH